MVIINFIMRVLLVCGGGVESWLALLAGDEGLSCVLAVNANPVLIDP